MSFSDHKITAFAHRIADLPDQPNLPADELKARFDSSPEELRQSVNGICDDAARLETRVDGIIAQTFEGEITREMLEEDVQTELDSKADADDVAAETQSLEARLDAVETALPQKCRVVIGTYTGNKNASKLINVGAPPKAVLVSESEGTFRHGDFKYGGLALLGSPSQDEDGNYVVRISGNGFYVYYNNSAFIYANDDNLHFYIAFI